MLVLKPKLGGNIVCYSSLVTNLFLNIVGERTGSSFYRSTIFQENSSAEWRLSVNLVVLYITFLLTKRPLRIRKILKWRTNIFIFLYLHNAGGSWVILTITATLTNINNYCRGSRRSSTLHICLIPVPLYNTWRIVIYLYHCLMPVSLLNTCIISQYMYHSNIG